jgi:hypothetical protein
MLSAVFSEHWQSWVLTLLVALFSLTEYSLAADLKSISRNVLFLRGRLEQRGRRLADVCESHTIAVLFAISVALLTIGLRVFMNDSSFGRAYLDPRILSEVTHVDYPLPTLIAGLVVGLVCYHAVRRLTKEIDQTKIRLAAARFRDRRQLLKRDKNQASAIQILLTVGDWAWLLAVFDSFWRFP